MISTETFFSLTQDTDAGILKDDLQQFRMFQAAMGLVTKSVDGRRGLELSHKAQSLLSDMTSIIWRVVRDRLVLVFSLFLYFPFLVTCCWLKSQFL